MIITQPECVFVALDIQHAMRIRRIFIWLAPLYCNTFPQYLINGAIFEKKKVTEHKMFILISSTTFV